MAVNCLIFTTMESENAVKKLKEISSQSFNINMDST